MTPTCRIPDMWSIGEACSALCGQARLIGEDQGARFNWVLLVARPGDEPADLAVAYWKAVAARADSIEGFRLTALAGFNAADASAAQAVGEAARRAINASRAVRA